MGMGTKNSSLLLKFSAKTNKKIVICSHISASNAIIQNLSIYLSIYKLFFLYCSDQRANLLICSCLLPKSFPSCTANNIRRQPSCISRQPVCDVFIKPSNDASKRIYDHVGLLSTQRHHGIVLAGNNRGSSRELIRACALRYEHEHTGN